MTEFRKTKIHFSLALLGTLFALHPFLERHEQWGFAYLDYDVKISHAYALVSGMLAFAVYCFALALLNEKPRSWSEITGNYSYAMALMVLPLLGGLYGASLLADQVGHSHWAWAAPTVALAVGLAWLVLSQLLAWGLKLRLSEHDQSSRIEHLAEREMTALNRAQEMFAKSHYDLSVIEAWKAIELRLRRVLLLRSITSGLDNPQAMIDTATQAGVIREPSLELLRGLRKQWNTAISVNPLSREAAESALSASRNILSTIPVEDPRTKHLREE